MKKRKIAKLSSSCFTFLSTSPQTCGLCYGQTPDPSLTCYDQIGEDQCRGLADKCFQYKGVCKKVRSWIVMDEN